MAPLSKDEVRGLQGGASGRFFSVGKDMKAGETLTVTLESIDQNTKTKYPIQGRNYGYRVAFTTDSGERRIWDISGLDTARQVVAAMYQDGPDADAVRVTATITRRTNRNKKQGEAEIKFVERASF